MFTNLAIERGPHIVYYCNDSDLIPRSSAKTWGHLMEILGKATGSPKKYEEMLGME